MTIVSLAARRRANPQPAPEPQGDVTDAADEAINAMRSPTEQRRAPDLLEAAPNEVSAPPPADAGEPVRVQGKFFFAGERKHFVRGVTYGPFATGRMARSSRSAPRSSATSR